MAHLGVCNARPDLLTLEGRTDCGWMVSNSELIRLKTGQGMARLEAIMAESGFIKTRRDRMSERTIWVDADQYKMLCDAAQTSGRPVSEIVKEALVNWIDETPEGEVTQA
jgi:hypothetical protein